MNELSYKKWLKNLTDYFEKKITADTGNVWFGEIGNIPEESLDYIAHQMKKKESFPRNFPATAWALYHTWLKDNPEKKAHNCPDCGGSGWISENRKAYKCGTCNREPLSVFIDIPGFTGNVNVKTKSKSKPEDWHDQF